MEKIEWGNLTSEEIRLKQLDISNSYESLKQVGLDILTELDLLEEEYNNSEKELNKRGI